MLEVDVYWFYWMSMATYTLHQFPKEGAPLGAIAGSLGMGRVAFETFGDERAKAFPKTSGAIKDILAWTNGIMPERDAQSQLTAQRMNSVVTPSEMATLHNLLGSLITFLRDESKHNYVICLEPQRLLSAHTLVERIEDCFSSQAWSVMDERAKDEFDESGKCLAFERHTASGFHALRGVEIVILQYVQKLTGGSIPRQRDWGSYIDVLRKNNGDKDVIAVLDNIRTLDRNPLMHPEDRLDVDGAVAVFMISQTAITRLAAALK